MATLPVYLDASKNALLAITRLYDFVWPAAAGLWNLRWQVAGYDAIRKNASGAELHARFVTGSGIHGANLQRACLEFTWADQRQQLAEVALINLFAVYESWLADALNELRLPSDERKLLEKQLQFPTNSNATKGIGFALRRLASPSSAALTAELYPTASVAQKVHVGELEEMLLVYRYFKEVRNCLVHSNGKADDKAVEASVAVGGIRLPLQFTLPKMNRITLATRVETDLYGVVGFGEVLRRLIFTLEVEFLKSEKVELLFLTRWRARHGKVQLKSDPTKRHRHLVRLIRKVGMPVPLQSEQLERLLRRQNLVS